MREVWTDGVLRERWNDGTRTYTAWDESGVQVTSRAYTAAEDAEAAARTAAATQATNRAQVDAALVAAMTSLQTLIGTPNATINASPASYIKDIAQVVKRVIRAVRGQYDAAN